MKLSNNYTFMLKMKWFVLIIPILVFLLLYSSSKNESLKNVNELQKKVIPSLVSNNLPFIVNRGQLDPEVDYYTNIIGGTVFITCNAELVYSLNPKSDKESLLTFKEHFTKSNKVSFAGKEKSNTNIRRL